MNEEVNNINLQSNQLIDEIDALNKRAWEVHISQPTLGLKLSRKALALSEEANYLLGRAYSTRNMGVSNRYLSNLEKALALSLQALDLFRTLEDEHGLAQALVSIGAIYYYMGDYDLGLDHFLQGLHHGEPIGNKEAMTYAYNGAGYIYSLLGENKKGLDFLHKALTLCREVRNYNIEASTLESLAVVYMNDNQIDKAYETYLTCVDLCEKNGEERNLGYALYGIGDILVKQNNHAEARAYFTRSLEIHKAISYKIGVSRALLQLGKLSLKEKKFEQAKDYLNESLQVGESIGAKAVMYKGHEALSNLFHTLQDFDLFAIHFKLFHKYKSEVFKEEQESKQKYLTLQHEMEKVKQESEINRLTNVVMKEKNDELQEKTAELERSYNDVSVLSKIGQDITATLNLETILQTVYENVNELMDATVFGIGIFNQTQNCIEYQMSIEKGKRYQPYQRTMEDKNQFPVWCIENKKEVFINDIHQEYSKYIPNKDLTILSSAAMEDGSLPENPNSLIYLPLLVKDLIIGLLSVQSYRKNAYTVNHLNILRTLASYTAAALYNAQSFETLQHTLEELQVTQKQLIQQEKMASLGELTAGIAHEIQNPLNFVNNFSEVSAELVDEAKEELAKGDIKGAEEILSDLTVNLVKINHHGGRASSIVKGMLDHSRTSSGEKSLTDINALCDEYLRLAYHGMRAKAKSFNAKFETDFDDRLPKVNVVPQDIGRVILNIINNAFHACLERSRKTYPILEHLDTQINKSPNKQDAGLVKVSTKIKNDWVEIIITDNGLGISDDIKDRIFQPFFTTKPTGQGTGLGLSLSYDIVKAHGGEIILDSKISRGTTFKITLPI